MSYLIVGSEHDMEVQIKYVTELAHNNSKSKIDITFPSYLFAEMFMDNLMANFKTEGVSKKCGLSIVISVPLDDKEL
tara:strand:+ start:2640 stop:2870 length:231 start_codon:yes stop_codon:yes gene_type:complete